MSQPMTLLELRDAIAKAVADAIGHGMREKCERHADEVLKVVAPQLLATADDATLRQQAARVDKTLARWVWANYEAEPVKGIDAMQRALEAALSAQPAEPVLDADARIGHMVFRKGVRWSTVIGAAQRQFKYHEAQPAERQDEAVACRYRFGDGNGGWLAWHYSDTPTKKTIPGDAVQVEPLYLYPAAPVGVPGWVTKALAVICETNSRLTEVEKSAKDLRTWIELQETAAKLAAPSAPQGVDRG